MATDEQRALAHARTVAEKVKQALAAAFYLGDETVAPAYACSASLGVVVLQGTPLSADGCLKRADAAMYKAKGKGQGGVWFEADAQY